MEGEGEAVGLNTEREYTYRSRGGSDERKKDVDCK